MDAVLIEFFIGLAFVGKSVTVTRTGAPAMFAASVDWFKLVFGLVLILMAMARFSLLGLFAK